MAAAAGHEHYPVVASGVVAEASVAQAVQPVLVQVLQITSSL